jgi:molybdopterin converting factor subunit 1
VAPVVKFAPGAPTIATVKVRLLYFAMLRDIVGLPEEEIEIEPGTRAVDVWQRLRQQHAKLRDYTVPPMTAINEAYVDPETSLSAGDELAFIPPVSGG